MSTIFPDFRQSQVYENGLLLATTITPSAPPNDPNRLALFSQSSDDAHIYNHIHDALVQALQSSPAAQHVEIDFWVDVYAVFWKVVGEILGIESINQNSTWAKLYNFWKELTNILIKGYSGGALDFWTIPCLYVAGRYLRLFAIKADEESSKKGAVTFNEGFQDDIVGGLGKNEKLEDAANILSRIFTLCINDRSPWEYSRKWGLYYATNLIFKTYFKLNSIRLCKNILRSLNAASNDIPELDLYPRSHRVTFKYYLGVISFLDENYTDAEEHLTAAWDLCYRESRKNRELILTYLVPCKLLNHHKLPSSTLLEPYPGLERLFRPLAQSIKKGDLAGFDAALAMGENEFVKRRVYLTLERGRDIALRNLFRKVFLAGGYEDSKDSSASSVRRSRVPVAEFAAAMRLGNRTESTSRTDMDEVECLLANMIYKGYMKGYISRERGIVVLSKGGAFPGTGV